MCYPGWSEWANFRLHIGRLFSLNISGENYQRSPFLDYFFHGKIYLCINFNKQLFGLHFLAFLPKLVWSPWCCHTSVFHQPVVFCMQFNGCFLKLWSLTLSAAFRRYYRNWSTDNWSTNNWSTDNWSTFIKQTIDGPTIRPTDWSTDNWSTDDWSTNNFRAIWPNLT
jgi:hypothetical protein